MNQHLLHLTLFTCLLGTLPALAEAQRVNFGLFATDGISITATGAGELNFNQKAGIILAGKQSVQILKTDDQAVILEIEGRIDLDVTLSIDADPNLVLQVGTNSYEIPLSVNFAYHNAGPGGLSDEIIKLQAIEVPSGFNGATFAMRRRTAGPPTPPPTPDHQGHAQPLGKSYVVIYGTMGQVPINSPVGLYMATINVKVEYATHEP